MATSCDSFNRTSSAQSQANSGTDCWGQNIPTDSTGYDRYGNLMNINSSKCATQGLSISVDANNHITGDTYDAAGEVTNDGLTTYTFDAEGRMTAAGGMTYTFDGDGRRVKKSSGTLYWYGAGSDVLYQTDLSGNNGLDYVFFGGRRLAYFSETAQTIYHYFQDALGSRKMMMQYNSNTPCYDADFEPYGVEHAVTNTCAQNYKFTGMERDSESGNDHTQYRQYMPNLGRWMSPDPVRGCPANPQNHNLYAYAVNNPTNFVDPSGGVLICAVACIGACEEELPTWWCKGICLELCATVWEAPIL